MFFELKKPYYSTGANYLYFLKRFCWISNFSSACNAICWKHNNFFFIFSLPSIYCWKQDLKFSSKTGRARNILLFLYLFISLLYLFQLYWDMIEIKFCVLQCWFDIYKLQNDYHHSISLLIPLKMKFEFRTWSLKSYLTIQFIIFLTSLSNISHIVHLPQPKVGIDFPEVMYSQEWYLFPTARLLIHRTRTREHRKGPYK